MSHEAVVQKAKGKSITELHDFAFNAGVGTNDCVDVVYPMASHPQYRQLRRAYPATDYLLRGRKILARIVAATTEVEEMLRSTVLMPLFAWIKENFVNHASAG
ncbi:unnamed protein product, partial [Amoebophrya sp. A25]|eukprot:GSA25T00022164001.1